MNGANGAVLSPPRPARTPPGILRPPELFTGLAWIVAEQVEKLPAIDAPLLYLAGQVVEGLDLNSDGGPGENRPGRRARELIRRGSVGVSKVKVAARRERYRADHRGGQGNPGRAASRARSFEWSHLDIHQNPREMSRK